jgi:hypothetical protein
MVMSILTKLKVKNMTENIPVLKDMKFGVINQPLNVVIIDREKKGFSLDATVRRKTK